MTVCVTYCSKKKRQDQVLLPACERYAGSHVRKALEYSLSQKMPLFFLSGFRGLVFSGAPTPFYDFYLSQPSDALIEKVRDGIRMNDITEILWITESSPAVQAYEDTLRLAAHLENVPIQTISLDSLETLDREEGTLGG